ncbi:MAG: hypothetical protein EOM30_08215 [Clostridia bacterium]|nr:hypothetical protein [Clostridia bacterium]NLS85053.1 hypothetical protein [Oscillospiraceae bacterium]
MKKHSDEQSFFAFTNAGGALEPLYSAKTLHISCGKTSSLDIQNCTSVLEYDDEKIKVGMGAVQLVIEGDSLVMDTLIKGCVTVHGRIFRIGFVYGDERV